MKHSIIAAAVCCSVLAGSVNAASFLTLQEKADQIQAIRDEANKAMEEDKAALDNYNNNRANLSDAQIKQIDATMRRSEAIMNGAQARIDAIRSTPLSPDAPVQKTPVITGTTYRSYITSLQAASLSQKMPTNSTIKKNVGDLPDDTKLKGTVKGKDIELTAKDLKKIDPTIQVDVPFNSAFMRPVKGNNHKDTNRSTDEHSTGNGSNNAKASHSAGGFSTTGSHIGGGNTGGGFAY